MTGPAAQIPPATLAGHYAGAVSRALAYALDAFLASALFALGVNLAEYFWVLAGGAQLDVDLGAPIALVGYGIWFAIYFGGSWAAGGKTPGMALLGVRVVRADGAPLGRRRALARVGAFLLTFATLGLGFLVILFSPERRGLHDYIAGTAVVYDWDARAARLRFLARRTTEERA